MDIIDQLVYTNGALFLFTMVCIFLHLIKIPEGSDAHKLIAMWLLFTLVTLPTFAIYKIWG